VRLAAEGSAKPVEVARGLGVWGSDDPRATHALIARLGFAGLELARAGELIPPRPEGAAAVQSAI
jgi:hypothetical protein